MQKLTIFTQQTTIKSCKQTISLKIKQIYKYKL